MSTIAYVSPSYLRKVASTSAIRKLRLQAVEALGLKSGSHVLDIGCGPGTSTIDFAVITGSSGHVVGLDLDPGMVQMADREALRAGVAGWTTHKVGDCRQLPFAASQFDACYSERLLQHLDHPSVCRTFSEALRVTKAGGRIAVADTDWGTLSIDSDEPGIERRIVATQASRLKNP